MNHDRHVGRNNNKANSDDRFISCNLFVAGNIIRMMAGCETQPHICREGRLTGSPTERKDTNEIIDVSPSIGKIKGLFCKMGKYSISLPP